MIVGWFVDGDIGNESLTNANDLCFVSPSGGSTYPNLAVQYQLAVEQGWSIPPPYLEGFKLVSGPVNNTRDTILVRSQPGIGYPQYDHDILPGQPIGFTSFQLFTISNDQATPGECYLELSGRYYATPNTLNSYQKDTFGPSDKRFLMACGPFDLPNDSTAKFVFGIIEALDSLELLRKAELLGIESPPRPVSQAVSTVTLYPVTPNPATGSALIRYGLPAPSPVSLRVYDISGRLIRELEKGMRFAGASSVRWDGRNESGRPVAGGVYFYRLEVSNKFWVRKMVLLH